MSDSVQYRRFFAHKPSRRFHAEPPALERQQRSEHLTDRTIEADARLAPQSRHKRWHPANSTSVDDIAEINGIAM